jgi:hypothetical protein
LAATDNNNHNYISTHFIDLSTMVSPPFGVSGYNSLLDFENFCNGHTNKYLQWFTITSVSTYSLDTLPLGTCGYWDDTMETKEYLFKSAITGKMQSFVYRLANDESVRFSPPYMDPNEIGVRFSTEKKYSADQVDIPSDSSLQYAYYYEKATQRLYWLPTPQSSEDYAYYNWNPIGNSSTGLVFKAQFPFKLECSGKTSGPVLYDFLKEKIIPVFNPTTAGEYQGECSTNDVFDYVESRDGRYVAGMIQGAGFDNFGDFSEMSDCLWSDDGGCVDSRVLVKDIKTGEIINVTHKNPPYVLHPLGAVTSMIFDHNSETLAFSRDAHHFFDGADSSPLKNLFYDAQFVTYNLKTKTLKHYEDIYWEFRDAYLIYFQANIGKAIFAKSDGSRNLLLLNINADGSTSYKRIYYGTEIYEPIDEKNIRLEGANYILNLHLHNADGSSHNLDVVL